MPAASASLPALPAANELLQTLLDVSLTGVILFRPVYAGAGSPEIVDLAYEHLNPAARHMLQLPARPAATFLTLYPNALEAGIFAFYRDTFLSGAPGRYSVNYQHDGLDNYFHLSARASGELLVVSFTDTADHERSAAEQALRESQAREQAARAEAELQREQLYHILEQAPAMICLFEGPGHVFGFVNPPYQALVGDRPLLGQPIAEAMPELRGQPIFDLLDRVYQTGETFHATEMLVQLDHANTGPAELDQRYYNFIYQARRNQAGAVDGIFVFAYDVTPQVLNRQQVQHLNEELSAANEELHASNEEFLSTNTELTYSQQQLRLLTQDLEARVAERTAALRAALGQTEQQRALLQHEQARLQQVLGQVPAYIATLEGPGHRHTFFNPGYHAWSGHRARLGMSVAEVYPETVEQDFIGLLDQVYATGQPFVGVEMAAHLLDETTGRPELRYVDFVYQPLRDEHGRTHGILVFIVDATDKVRARQQAEALQAEVRAGTERLALERATFQQVFARTPALIALVYGPEFVFGYVNPAFQALFAGQHLAGRPYAEALPDVYAQGYGELLRQVYQSGQSYVGESSLLQLPDAEGRQQPRYYNFTYEPFGNPAPEGVFIFAFEVSEQVRARHEREQQRQRLERLFMQAPAAISILAGPGLVYELVNPGYQALFPGRELLGRRVADALPEIVDGPVYAGLQQVYATGASLEAQALLIPLTRPDGQGLEDRYFNYVLQARFDGPGQVDGVLIFAFEVTEQVRAQQRAERSEQEFSTLLESIPQMTWTNAPDGSVLFFNGRWYDYTGLSAGQSLAWAWQAVAHPDDVAALTARYRACLASGEDFSAETRFRRAADGAYRWHLSRAVPLRDDTGRILQWVGTATDIDAQKHLEQRLLESEQYFRLMADTAPGMLWVTNPLGDCTYLNEPWYAFTGQTEEEGMGLGWVRAVHPDDAEAAGTTFLDANARREPFHCPFRLRRHDGQYRWVIDTGQPRFSADGDFEGMVGTVFDVHEQKLAEQALQRLTRKLRSARDQAEQLNDELRLSNQQLLRTNVDLDSFIYTASHDLKAPITNIEGLLHVLQEQLPPAALRTAPELQSVLGMMHESVTRFKRTLDHLSDVTKLQKEHDQPVSLVALAEVVRDVALDLQPLIAETRALLHTDVGACPYVSFSAKNLRSVVYNLLSNALKYHYPERPPQVHVRCREEGEFTVLEVQDNGLGLDEGQQNQLFTMFRRLHTHVEGSGVGLYMVKRSVENAGGRVTVHSEPGVGSTFAVYFRR